MRRSSRHKESRVSRGGPLPAHQSAEGQAGARPDQGSARGAGAQHRALHHQAHGAGDREGVALGHPECAPTSRRSRGSISTSTTSTLSTAVANEGPRMKRIRPAPMGRAFRYQRRIAHIIITVAEEAPHRGDRGCGGDAGARDIRPNKTVRSEEGRCEEGPCQEVRGEEGSGEEEGREVVLLTVTSFPVASLPV
jgi:hypothetical protein